MWLVICPLLYDTLNINIFVVKENHSHSGDSSWGSINQRVCFKDETSAIGEINSFTRRKGEQMIVI